MVRSAGPWAVLGFVCAMVASNAVAVTFDSPAELNTNAATDTGDDSKPQVATDKSGHWITVWQSSDTLGNTVGSDLDIFVSRSNDNGATWSPPEVLNSNAATDSGDDTNPKLSTDRAGRWVCVWQSTSELSGGDTADTDIAVSVSVDNGQTWSDIEALNTTSDADGAMIDRNPTVSTDTHGAWICAWESDNSLGDTIGSDLDILVSRSIDNGQTWSAPIAAKNNADSDGAATDERPCVVGGANDVFILAWQSNDTLNGFFDGSGDIIYAYSNDHGASWTGPLALSVNTFLTNNGPDENVSLATDENGTVLALWDGTRIVNGVETDKDVYIAYSQSSGIGYSYYTDLSAAGGAGVNDERPFAATDGKSTWFCIWERTSTQGGHTDTDFVKVESFALQNSFLQLPLNDNTASDTGDDRNISGATDSMGHWVLAWDSDEVLSKSAGPDTDIAYATRKSGSKDDIRLTKPNGKKNFKIGAKIRIHWSPTYDSGPAVTIELLQGKNVAQVIAESFRNRGRKGWHIPVSVSPGTGYKVRVRSSIYPEIKATSKTFEIKPAK